MASGDAAESAQMTHGQQARRARDVSIRAAFGNPEARHREAVSEAELDIDYAGSPIVMGDRHEAIWPGQRLPDHIDVRYSTGGVGKLHDYAKRRGHTVLLIGGPGTAQQPLSDLRRDLEALSDGHIIEVVVALTASQAVTEVDAYLDPAAAARLGVGDMVLLAVRADGHVGLRADARHAETLSAYIERLRA